MTRKIRVSSVLFFPIFGKIPFFFLFFTEIPIFTCFSAVFFRLSCFSQKLKEASEIRRISCLGKSHSCDIASLWSFPPKLSHDQPASVVLFQSIHSFMTVRVFRHVFCSVDWFTVPVSAWWVVIDLFSLCSQIVFNLCNVFLVVSSIHAKTNSCFVCKYCNLNVWVMNFHVSLLIFFFRLLMCISKYRET